ncbi:TRAP transporter large permease subunit [uncultured Tateyamaria sp.]|uniref:TRAP transporter large permease subunit n=1 Tax=Tateyamaria sp. 1078 TaxID=3417464 RepID=UPI0026233D06|nr:TRAP transporter large permease subunit [uncultured Tateyamaria sp.]
MCAFERIPQAIAETVLSLSDNRYAVIAIVIGLLLVVGMMIDITAILIIPAPVFVPLIESDGPKPVHAGVIFDCWADAALLLPRHLGFAG